MAHSQGNLDSITSEIATLKSLQATLRANGAKDLAAAVERARHELEQGVSGAINTMGVNASAFRK